MPVTETIQRTIVRSPTAADEAGWRRQWAQYLDHLGESVPDDMTAHTWGRILDEDRPDLFARIAERGGQVVGFAVCVLHAGTWTRNPICYLEDLGVDAAARGEGVGRALIDDLLRLAREQGWARLYWHTGEDNVRARRLYDKFVPVGDVVRYQLYLE